MARQAPLVPPASSGAAAWFSRRAGPAVSSPHWVPAAGENDLLRRDPLGQVCPDHPVGGGGIEPVPGKKGPGLV